MRLNNRRLFPETRIVLQFVTLLVIYTLEPYIRYQWKEPQQTIPTLPKYSKSTYGV